VIKGLERFSTMSVLVVDDDKANLDLIRGLLYKQGLQRVSTETDSRRVASILPEVDPDLVLLDLHMPHLDGHALLETITQFAAGSYLPVLVFTGNLTTDARDRALTNGARDFLTKPLDMTEVTLRVANLLETRQLYTTLRRTVSSPEYGHQEDVLSRGRIETVLSELSINPVFQRVVQMTDMTTVGYEALARFPQPHERGPAGWFGDAFRVGLGVELEWLAVKRALTFLETSPTEMFLSLNMSPATILHLQQEDLCSPELFPRIVIELTEHVPIEDYSAIHQSLRYMRERGTRLAADDLGSGYAGFRHLIALEPDIIKLDQSIVAGIHRSRGARALASAIVAFADDVGAIVIAEGVEEAPEFAELLDLGVPWAQGYFVSHPEPSPYVLNHPS
jgi:EAL domain-containing protein (putative c-di-GMP-specific phosphodiesterase class I)